MANQPKKYKKFVATAATATLVASAIVPVASAAAFNDVAENNEFAPYIDALVEQGIINGYSDGTFKPGASLTRGQVVKMLGRWVEAQGVEIPSDWNSKQRFSDVPVNHKDSELVKYAALVADNGVFTGAAGKLMAGNNITRQQMAKVLNGAYEAVNGVSLIELADGVENVNVRDLFNARAEFEDAIQALADLEISTTASGNFRPTENVTRAQFAKFLYNTINLEAVASANVKAINATTVEVTFDEEVGNINDYKFEIAGLDIKNVAKKQSDAKTVVLTTAVQEAGKEYTVTVNDEEVGKFTGVSAVLPTAIDIVEKSQQNVLGNQVTVTAKVTVATGDSAAGIPVTFNIINGETNNQQVGSNLNPTIVGEAVTNADGVATYTYTRYASTARDLITHDEVQAYATGKATVRSFSKVYWGAIQPLTITEVTEGNKITNGGKKVYKVKLAGVSTNVTPGGNQSRTVNIGFKENVNVAPDKAVKSVTVTDSQGNNLNYPGQFTTTGSVTTGTFNSVVLQLDANGEATFTLTGSNATITPFVFKDIYANTNNTDPSQGRFDATELFAEAPKLTFEKIQTLQVEVTSLGVSNASAYSESFNQGATYRYINTAAGTILVRDVVGTLTTAPINAVPTNATIINQNNPLRTGEALPAGFVVDYTSGVANNAGVTALNNRLGTNASYIYNQTNGKDLLTADLVNTGGRDYKAVIKNVDGKLATSNTPVKVQVDYGTARTATQAAPIYVIDNNSRTVYKISDFDKTSATYNFLTDAKGEISFTIIGGRDSYATPTVFIETGDKAGLDKNDAQHAGEIVYFGDRTITTANLTVNDKEVTSTTVSGAAKFSYKVADQNGKYYYLWNNTTSTTNSNIFETSFEVSSQFSVAYVYDRPKDEAGARLLETVPQGSTRTVKVNSTLGKADIYVYSTVGNTVTVNASASQGTYPNKTASATFSNLLNEGVESEVKGRIVAIDKDNNRILLSNSKGDTVYELKYGETTDELAVGGVNVTESTFEHSLRVGEELHFVQKTDTTKAKFNNFNFDSGVKLSATNLNLILINGDQTAQPKVYDFGRYTTDGGTTLVTGTTGSGYDALGRQEVTAKQLVINGDNITVKNLALTGDLVVGVPAGSSLTQPQLLNDFTINNSSVSGTTTVNRGDGSTFNVEASTLTKVILNIKEHVAVGAGSTITELIAKVDGSTITPITSGAYAGTGTVTTITTNPGVTVAQSVGASVISFTAKTDTTTTTNDTAVFTFAPALSTNPTASLTVGGTVATLDTASVSTTNVKFTIPTAIVSGTKLTFTVNGFVYEATYTAPGTLTFTRKEN
ncbi:S-layer homology domain-containing protein [Lysinibacillus sp. KU-BSD001]|uniref:S-layer homology domain-containing protein n=1 Tax=Lysinibacillus sp. KU-BSD001 TaxID=3141328 RepID=UPI0036E46990